mgnify:CR=1 FL=1
MMDLSIEEIEKVLTKEFSCNKLKANMVANKLKDLEQENENSCLIV